MFPFLCLGYSGIPMNTKNMIERINKLFCGPKCVRVCGLVFDQGATHLVYSSRNGLHAVHKVDGTNETK